MVQKLGFSGSYSIFGKDGKTMVPNERVHCSRGTSIHAVGYAGNMQYFVVYDDDMNAVEICNGKLSCGPGWIFSKKKEAEIRAALSL